MLPAPRQAHAAAAAVPLPADTMAQGISELPYLFSQGLLYTILVYFIIGFEHDASKFW